MYNRLMGKQYVWQPQGWHEAMAAAVSPSNQQLEQVVRKEAEELSAVTQALSSGIAAEAHAALLADEGTMSNAIEGVKLSRDSFFASALRRLGALPRGQVDRRHAPAIEALIDATENAHEPLTETRLHRWQEAALAHQTHAYFPALTGMYRATTDEMQIVTRHAAGRETVHYTAPPADRVIDEMNTLIEWINASPQADTFTGAAIAHLWFEIIHPYEDGNGRVGRLLWDRQIARAAADAGLRGGRWWSVSHEIARNVTPYYDALNAASTGRSSPEDFAQWGLQTTIDAFQRTRRVARDVVTGHEILARSASMNLNHRQRDLLGLLVKFGSEGFERGVSVRKYGSLTGASRATASRDLAGLVDAGFLLPHGEGRSRVYDLAWDATTGREQTSDE